MTLALAALLSLASGYALVSLSWTRRAASLSSDVLLRISLSVGLGLGMFSLTYFLLVCLFGFTHLVVVDSVICALLLLSCFLVRTRDRATKPVTTPKETCPTRLRRVLSGAFAVSLCAAFYAAAMRTFAHAHIDGWDAFAIWNLHARFLLLGGAHWRDGFTALIPWSHPDYPLLLPAAIAHFWSYLGHDDPRVPAAIGFVFTFATVGVLFSSLSMLRGRTSAMLATIALVATPAFIEQGTAQYADVPLSFFYLAAIVLLCLSDYWVTNNLSGPTGLLVLTGLAAGFAAWTKNEGLLFLVILVALLLLLLALRKTGQPSPRYPGRQNLKDWTSLVPLVASTIPFLLLILWFKHSLVPLGDLLSDPGSWLHKVLSPSRYWIVVQWYAKAFLRFGHWLVIPGTIPLLALYLVARKGGSEPSLGIRTSTLALTLTLAGYFGIYLITPNDIYWQLRFSLTRLFLQVWPSFIFLVFLVVRVAPEAPDSNAGRS